MANNVEFTWKGVLLNGSLDLPAKAASSVLAAHNAKCGGCDKCSIVPTQLVCLFLKTNLQRDQKL